MKAKLEIQNLNALPEVAKQILTELQDKKLNLLALIGDLGAGKTTFTQYLGRELGIEKTIQSPTFVLMNEYDIENKYGFKSVNTRNQSDCGR